MQLLRLYLSRVLNSKIGLTPQQFLTHFTFLNCFYVNLPTCQFFLVMFALFAICVCPFFFLSERQFFTRLMWPSTLHIEDAY